MSDESLKDLKEELKEILKKNHDAFVGKYAEEIDELLGFSRSEIDAIVPDATDLEVYDQLITIVKDASQRNLSQAELKARIETLGDIAVTIAKKSTKLAKALL
jgi:mannitol-1-phosphate/altronate dehydrogenase